MAARKVVRLLAAKEETLSKKDELYNHVHAWLEKQELGWTSDIVDSSGKAFINVLTDVFWCIDGHHGNIIIIIITATRPHALINFWDLRNH